MIWYLACALREVVWCFERRESSQLVHRVHTTSSNILAKAYTSCPYEYSL